MDPLDQNQLQLVYLEDAAKALDSRLAELRTLRTRNEGALQAMAALDAQMEQHRRALLQPPDPVSPERREAVDGQISGLQDGMTFLRAAKKAEESQGFILYGQELESAAARRRVSASAQDIAAKMQKLMAELEAGVPRGDVGRPTPPEAVRDEVAARRAAAPPPKASPEEVDACRAAPPPTKAEPRPARERRREAVARQAATEHIRRRTGAAEG